MKFKLKDLIYNHNDIVGHLFLHTINSDFAERHRVKNNDELETKEIDIKLLINGEEFDIREWLESFRENYFKYVKNKAQELLAKRLSEKVDDISNELENLRSKIIEVETSIDLD
jgi:hypothetical protein